MARLLLLFQTPAACPGSPRDQQVPDARLELARENATAWHAGRRGVLWRAKFRDLNLVKENIGPIRIAD